MDYANGSLTIPRVKVVWGPNNNDITEYVYEVRVSLDEQGQTPTGSMKWDPSPKGYQYYEAYIKEYKDWSIMVTFYYVAGKSITFEFYWGGQSEVYGKEMEITVKLVSFLDGLINANFYASAQTDVGEKGISYSDAVGGLMKQFGLKGNIGPGGNPLDIIRYTPKAWQDMNESIVKFNYNDGATFMDAVQNLVKDNGNNVFFNNIGTANAVIYTPYSWEDYTTADSAISPGWLETQNPNPARRYGYFIGPGIIQSFTRAYEWQPPQKSQEITAMMNRKAEERKAAEKAAREARRGSRGGNRNRNRDNPDRNAAQSAAVATAPSGVHGSKNSGGIRSDKNENGPRKQDIFTKERAAKLSLSTLMCPSLVGLKPLDILFIPSYNGTYIEDWIVSSVEYQQNDKGVDLSVQATRWYGEDKALSEVNSDRYLEVANGLRLVGRDPKLVSLENWVKYAWEDPLKNRIPLTSEAPATTSTPPPEDNQYVSYGSDEYIREKLALFDAPPLTPSSVIVGVRNVNGIKPEGSTTPGEFIYVIKDPMYALYLKGRERVDVDLDRKPLYTVEALSNGDNFVTGPRVTRKFFEADYASFLKVRTRFIQESKNQLLRDFAALNSQRPQPSSSGRGTAAASTTGSGVPSPLRVGENPPPSTPAAPTTGQPAIAPATAAGQSAIPQQNVPASASSSAQPATPTASATAGPQGASSSPQPAPQPILQSQVQQNTGPFTIPTKQIQTLLQITSKVPSSAAITAGTAPDGSPLTIIDDIPFADWLFSVYGLTPKEANVTPLEMLRDNVPVQIRGVLSVNDARKLRSSKMYLDYQRDTNNLK